MAQRTVFNPPSYSEASNAQQTQAPNLQPAVQNFLAAQQLAQGQQQNQLMAKLQEARLKMDQLRLDPELAHLRAQTDALGAKTSPEQLGLMRSQANLNNAQAKKLGTAAEEPLAPAKKMSPAQIVIDKEFGKEFNEYVTQGGSAGIKANLDRLGASITELQGVVQSGGGFERATGSLPGFARGIIAPQYKKIEQDARTNVLAVLRQTLGPQFTEKEGERIFSQTFDPSLPPETNLQRLTALKGSLEAQAASKESAIQYFNQNGTLEGFQGTTAFSKEKDPNAEKKAALRAKLGL